MGIVPRFGVSDVRIVGRWDWNVSMKCLVCQLQVRHGEEAVRCPHCGNISHKVHMLEWLHVRGSCPACSAKLTEQELEKVNLE